MNDEQLILYYYDDGLTDTEKHAIAAALGRDGDLADRYRNLVQALAPWAEHEDEPIPDDLRRRLHVTIDRAADLERGRRPEPRRHNPWTYFLLGAGTAAAIVVAVATAIAPGMRQPAGLEPSAAEMTAELDTEVSAAPAPFVRAMQVYFRDSRLELESLPDTGNGDRTAMIVDLIEQNRAFARLAARNESPDLARVLRAFEPILIRLAAEDITAEDSAALRDKLAFELNVMLTKVTREASQYVSSTNQETST